MNATRVLLIVPPLIPYDELKSSTGTSVQWSTNCSIPMGLLSIAAYTGKYTKVEFKFLDLNVEILKNVREFKTMDWNSFLRKQLLVLKMQEPPAIVGISAIFNSNAGYIQLIAAFAKEIWPGVIVTAGGGLPTNMYDCLLDLAPDLDAIAIGEGEKPFLGLVKAEDRTKYLLTATGWVTRESLKAGLPVTMDLVSDLDEIPFFRYDLIDFEEYQKVNRFHGEKSSDSVTASIMTSRGCPYLCNFCASHSVHGHKLRFHSPERVLEDICLLKEKYGVTIILIEDDNFIVNKRNALKILNGISKEELAIEFPNGLSITHHDEEIVDALKAAGLKMATLAVESGSERVLADIINKPYKDLARVRAVVSLYRKKDIYVRAFFIIGFPGETKEEIFDSVRFMKETGFNWVAIMIASPIAGSDLYEQCKKEKLLLTDKFEDFHYGKCNIKLPHSSPDEIEKLRYMINLEVNFVDNYDLKNGHLEIALIGFKDVINRVSDHAFAFYFAAECYRRMGEYDMAQECMQNYTKIVGCSTEWAAYAKVFDLPIKSSDSNR